MKFFRKWIHRFTKLHTHGAVGIEFAMILPLMAIVILASIDISGYYAMGMKLERGAYTVANLVTQSKPCGVKLNDKNNLTDSYLHDIVDYGGNIFYPKFYVELTSSNNEGKIIVSSISKQAVNVKLNWQRIYGNTAITGNTIGTGSNANVPSDFSAAIANGDNFIVVETFVKFRPIFLKPNLFNSSGLLFFNNNTISTIFYMAPRNGKLITAPPSTKTC